MILVEVLVLALVSFRLWRVLALDSITERLRERITSDLAMEWVACPWCSGTWIAVAATLAASWTGLIQSSPWLVAPAAAAVVGFVGDNA